MRVVIAGGGSVGKFIAEQLHAGGHDVLILDTAGRWLIGRVVAVMQAAMSRNAVDATLTKYLGSIVAIALNITLVLGILGYFGIQTTSFAAILAGAGVAIGAAVVVAGATTNCPLAFPVAGSKKRTVPSKPAAATVPPSGFHDNA